MEKIFAIPLENGVLCGHFGHCQAFAIAEVTNNEITKITEAIPPGMFRDYILAGLLSLE